MPKVKSYSASWLSGNAPGHQLFGASPGIGRSRGLTPASLSKKKTAPGPRRTIARRGTEVFVAVGKEIRWGDLVYLREEYANRQGKGRNRSDVRIKREDSYQSSGDFEDDGVESTAGLRVIKTPVADDIRQLIISPNSNLLAILTAHTVHICVLPDPSHLTSEDTGPLKPKIFTLGPTTHVTSRSPVMSALWHPLGVNGYCIVTVTSDAIVRVWELSIADRWSFDTPTTSVDLKKLADGTTLDQDYSASVSTTNKAFSPDSFEMEVASASFPAKGTGGWNPMTLWIAMREGDVYALCPLLPQRWSPPPTLLPSLSVSVVTTGASIEDDPSVDEQDRLLAQQQMEWMAQIDSQEPQVVDGLPGDPPAEIYFRPSRPGVIPRLQGPFELASDPDTGDDLDTSITDIFVIGKRIDTEDLMLHEDEDLYMEDGSEGLSVAVICLLSTSGQVRVYLDLTGVQAKWLPPKTKARRNRFTPDSETCSLQAFQAIDTMTPVEVNEESWPVFSTDELSRYNFYVTHHAAITFISLTSWIFRLEGELTAESEAGTDFRIGLLVNTQSSRDRLYSQALADVAVPLAAAVAIRDPDLGYCLLSSSPYEPILLTFETPDLETAPAPRDSPVREREPSMAPLDFCEPRQVFQPSHTFDQDSALPTLLERLRTSRHKAIVNQEVKLSPATLQIFTGAHKVLSDETYKLGMAAADVFKRCELLQAELQQQVSKANEVNTRIEAISGAEEGDEPDNAMYERRLRDSKTRQQDLNARLERLRKMTGKATTRNLSAKERAFVEEVKSVQANIEGSSEDNGPPAMASATTRREQQEVQQKQSQQLWQRLENVKSIQADLIAQVEALDKAEEAGAISSPELRIPQEVRRSKLHEVQGLLARETALVEAVTSRMRQLQTSV